MIMKILFVDDEEDIRKVGEVSLAKVGNHDVHVAANVDEAMTVLSSEVPDLILLDVMMPGTDGLTMLERLRADSGTKDIPVIFMTAKVQKHEVEDYMARGAKGVIKKPFDPLTLPDEIGAIVG